MNTLENTVCEPPPSLWEWLAAWLAARSSMQRWLLGASAAAALIVLAYVVEDWHGKMVWENYRRESLARGVNLDWSVNVPPPVPDDENFFKAPNMQNWFVGRGGNGFSARLGLYPTAMKPADAVMEVTFKPADSNVVAGEADMIFRLAGGHLTVSTELEGQVPGADASKILPLVVMDEVPLQYVIKNLAKQAEINYMFSPGVQLGSGATAEPIVSGRWSNVVAEQLLKDILRDYNLAISTDAKTRISCIYKKNPSAPVAPVNSAASAALGDLIRGVVDAATNEVRGAHVTAPIGFEITAGSFGPYHPARVVVLSDTVPDSSALKEFFPGNFLSGYSANWSQVRVEPDDDTNSFHVFLTMPPWVSAADCVAASDPLEPDFDEVREALKRPYARMDGDYEHPEAVPIPNFVCVRILAQMLGQRTKSYLLLNQPEKALRELTLLHDMRRVLEARPTGRSMTLVAAMINVAVTGLYVDVIADGMRLHAWREPDLAAIQEQLRELDLEPFLADAFKFHPASNARLLETTTSGELARMFTDDYKVSANPQQRLEHLKDPTYWFFLLAPRGWMYQNMAFAGRLQQAGLDGFDLDQHLVLPKQADASVHRAEKALKHPTPYNVIARIAVPNLARATQTCARNQTLVNEGFIACALERYHLVRGHYPATLGELTPQFAEKLPHDLIGGGPLKYRIEGETFVLYSVGWNETDEGGIPDTMRQSYGYDLVKNDWVWPNDAR